MKRFALRAAIAVSAFAPALANDTFDFTVLPASSGLDGQFGSSFDSSGTVIGNFNADTNPTGTRTKPGLFGSFGATENLPVAVTATLDVSALLDTAPEGSFSFELDIAGGTLIVRELVLDLLASGPQPLTTELTVQTESFRTRSPDSTFPGGFPVTFPIDDTSLLSLVATQGATPVAGTLMQTGPNEYDFAASATVSLTGQVQLFGTQADFGPFPLLVPLEGHLSISGDTATLTSTQQLNFQDSQTLAQPLPETPLAVPTVLPPGGTASLLLNLTLDTADATLDGTQTLTATGVKNAGLLGDLNCNGVVNVADIGAFVLALTNPAGYAAQFPDCDINNADTNGNGVANVADIGSFVALLTS